MTQKQPVTLFGMVAVALILGACGSDSGNNSSESEGDSSSSIQFSSSSGPLSSSSGLSSSSVPLSSSGGVSLSSSLVVSSSSVTLQSSSSVPLSSSVGESSSSSSIEDGTLTYEGQTYKTVVIGTQTWMAENLNYAVDRSWCYNNSADSCAKYGRLYQWTSAMDIGSTYNSVTWGGSDVNHQGICPEGWHLPNDEEWQTLYDYVDANNGSDGVGTSLKSVSGWKAYSGVATGTDHFGFSALPAGYRDYNGGFSYVGDGTFFWSATEFNSGDADVWHLDYYIENFYGNSHSSKHYGEVVRCIQD